VNRIISEKRICDKAKARGIEVVTAYQVSLFDDYVLMLGIGFDGENKAMTARIDEISCSATGR
jgi:hypothetical protein